MKVNKKEGYSSEMKKLVTAVNEIGPVDIPFNKKGFTRLCNLQFLYPAIPEALEKERVAINKVLEQHASLFVRTKTPPYRILLGEWEHIVLGDDLRCIKLGKHFIDVELLEGIDNLIMMVDTDQYLNLKQIYMPETMPKDDGGFDEEGRV